MKKEMEGTYVGTVAREYKAILRRETKPLLQAIFLSTSTLLIQKNVMVMTVIMMKMVTTMYK